MKPPPENLGCPISQVTTVYKREAATESKTSETVRDYSPTGTSV
jgi:hypothetical protein